MISKEEAESLEVGDVIEGKCNRCGWSRPDTRYITVFTMGVRAGAVKSEEVICEDCDMEERRLKYRKTGELTTWLIMHMVLRRARVSEHTRLGQTLDAIEADMKDINKGVAMFDQQVWRAGLRDEYMAAPERGLSSHAEGVDLDIMCSAGRVLIQLVRKATGDRLTMITTDEDKPRNIGVQGIACNRNEANNMIGAIWRAYQAGSIKLKANKDLSIM
jgi:hypothetical protein